MTPTHLHTPTPGPVRHNPTSYILCVWHGHELAYIDESSSLSGLVNEASKLIREAKLAGMADVSANIAPKGAES